MNNATELYCFIDDFCKQAQKQIDKKALQKGKKNRKPTRTSLITNSEIITIILLFQQSGCLNFKTFYTKIFSVMNKGAFPMLSYSRFVFLKKNVFVLFSMLIKYLIAQGKGGKVAFIDSTVLPVCSIKRAYSNKVFYGLAKKAKSSMGWFYGIKLHLIINEKGQLQQVKITPGNVDDRKPVEQMTIGQKGLLVGDKGYISQSLFKKLYSRGLKLITGIKRGMANKLLTFKEKLLLRKRSIIETVFSVLKCHQNMVSTRHRNPINGLIHIFASLCAYCLRENKPSIS